MNHSIFDHFSEKSAKKQAIYPSEVCKSDQRFKSKQNFNVLGHLKPISMESMNKRGQIISKQQSCKKKIRGKINSRPCCFIHLWGRHGRCLKILKMMF